MVRRSVGIIALALVSISGCFSPDPKSLQSNSAPSAVPAIKDAATQGDRSAYPRLVEDLDDPDPAIRFAAIQALERMTGETFGYRYYDDESTRRPAVQQWQQWLVKQPSS
jgi:HEAT repeat protein